VTLAATTGLLHACSQPVLDPGGGPPPPGTESTILPIGGDWHSTYLSHDGYLSYAVTASGPEGFVDFLRGHEADALSALDVEVDELDCDDFNGDEPLGPIEDSLAEALRSFYEQETGEQVDTWVSLRVDHCWYGGDDDGGIGDDDFYDDDDDSGP
jgi:hypothetical protein